MKNIYEMKNRFITLITMIVLFELALCLMHSSDKPYYLVVPDIGHCVIPNIRDWFGHFAGYIWWAGSFSEEIYGALLVFAVLIYGKAARWGVAFALVAFSHALLWRATLLPTPPDIMWRFPLYVNQVPRANDFWFSGHAGSAMLLVLYTWQYGWKIRILSLLYLVFMIWLVLATRTHYTIDVLGGLLISYVIYDLVNRYWRWN